VGILRSAGKESQMELDQQQDVEIRLLPGAK
jgi:hypothetical protein